MTRTPGRLHPEASTTPAPPRRNGAGRVVRYVSAIVFTLVVAAFVLPDLLFGIDGRSPFAQLAAFRPLAVVGCAVLSALLLLALVFERRVWPFAAGVLVVAVIGGALVLPRTIADPLPTGGTPLTVLVFNTFEGEGDVEGLAEMIRAQRPDVVSVVEAGTDYRSRLAPLVEPLGYRLQTSVDPGEEDVQGVTAVVAAGLGDVTTRIGEETSAFPYLELTGGGLGALRFVAFHSVAPVPGSVPEWRDDLALLSRWCAGPTPAIVAGDFNATLDHSALRSGMAGCEDAAEQRGQGLVPTWGPTPGTRTIGPQIDHVLVTEGIAAETFAVGDIAGSDHRAVLTRLRIP
ncbi:MAG: endonuclease/exonuclease/phosphatase family protein [Pseudonocardia sp.]|nr:endonuclease/exonuclease/phosphatase family protein [Pseudonocardia sp.]